MGGLRREYNRIYILCDNIYTAESHIAATVAEASLMTGISKNYINTLIKTGKQTRDGWVFDETGGEEE